MADEGFSWDEPSEDTTVATTQAAPAAPAAPAAVAAKPPSAAAPVAASQESASLPEAEVPPPDEDKNYRRPLQLYKHWVRPKFLQYRYMYDYRTNYYNDVIDYLDKRANGINSDIPRAQTWAERVLRTHSNPHVQDYYSAQKKDDKHLIQTIAATIKTHNYHTKAYLNRKYSNII